MGVLSHSLGFRALSVEDPAQPLLPYSALFDSLGLGRSDAGVLVNEKQALRLSTAYGCIKIISEDLSRLPLEVFQQMPDGSLKQATSHRLWPILHDRPNENMSSMVWRGATLASALAYGNAYSWIKRDRASRVIGLYPLSADKTSPVKINGKLAFATTQTDTGEAAYLDPQHVLHFMGVSLDGNTGMSPIQTCKNAFGLGLAAEKFGAQFFGNGARATGVLSHPNNLDPEAYENLKKSVREWATGEFALRPIILEEGMKWEQVSIPPEEAQFIATRKFQKEEIACLYRVPMHLLQDLSRCLPGDAEVYTTEGPRPIRELRPGDPVWSYDSATGRIVTSAVSRLWVNGHDRILTIRTTNRTLRCNARHKVLARVRVSEPSMAIVGGYRDGGGGLHSVRWENVYIPAGELKSGDCVIALGRVSGGGIDELPSGRRATVGFAEFSGLLLSDGNVTKLRGEPVGVQIARDERALYMDHYRDVMRGEFGRSRLTEGRRQTCFKSVSVAMELDMLGLSGTALTKRIPGWVYMMPAEQRLGFLRGFLDGDGTVDTKGRIVYRTINREMISGLRHLCVGLGIPVTNIQRVNNRRTAYINGHPVTGKHDLYSFTCSDPGANRRIGSHDPRYVTRFSSGKPFSKKGRKYPRCGGKNFEPGDVELSRIVSIEESSILEPVYDLEVERTHSYVADCVVVSNSTNNNIEHQGLDYVRFCLAPWAVRMEQEINYKLLGGPFVCEHNLNDLQRGDFSSQTNGFQTLRNIGVYSANDILRALRQNLIPPEEGGDVRTVQGAMIPLSALVSEESVPETAQTDSDEGNPAASQRHRHILSAYRPLFRDAVGRAINRGADAEFVRRAVHPAITSMAQSLIASRFGNSELTRRDIDTVSSIAADIAAGAGAWQKPDAAALATRITEQVFGALAQEILR